MKKTGFIAATVVAVVMAVLITLHLTDKSISQVKVGVSLSQNMVPNLDPTQVQSGSQALIAGNLYSSIVEYDKFGQIQAGIATKFYWNNDSLFFEFGERVKTISGHTINANDAAISIRRLIKTDSSVHVNLKALLCNIQTAEDVFKDCEGVKVVDQKLVITPHKKLKPFLLKILTTISVVPASQIDKTTLAIAGAQETTGGYYLASRDEKKWVLKTNHHYRINKNTAKEVILIHLEPNEIWNAFLENKIDIVTTANTVDAEVMEKIKGINDLSIAETMALKLYFIKFSPKALKDFTAEQRHYLGERFKQVMLKKYSLPIGYKITNQIFSDVGYGHLSQEQEEKINNLRQNAKPGIFKRKPQFYNYRTFPKVAVFSEISEIEPVLTDLRGYMQKPEERMDIFTGAVDAAYAESLSLFGYNFAQGTFGLTEKEAAAWMQKYIETEDEQARFKMTQDLHFKTLENGVTIPLVIAPYTAVARNKFKVIQSKLFTNTTFWNIVKE